MRLREFLTEQPPGGGGGAIGAALGQFAGKAANYPMMYAELYKQYREERLKREKEKKAEKEATAKEKAAKKKLQDIASKMTPQQKVDVKKQLDKQPAQPQKSTTPGKPEIGQLGYGTDGRTYKWAGQQWLSPTGGIKRKGVQVLVK